MVLVSASRLWNSIISSEELNSVGIWKDKEGGKRRFSGEASGDDGDGVVILI